MKIRTITEDYIKDLLAQDTREDGRNLLISGLVILPSI